MPQMSPMNWMAMAILPMIIVKNMYPQTCSKSNPKSSTSKKAKTLCMWKW